MFNHLYVYQSKETSERNVNAELIKKIYSIIYKNELDPYLDNTTNLIGKINIGYTYQFYLDKIHEKFPDLEINADGTYVYFEDKNVERILIDNFCDEYDGVMLDTRFDPSNGFYKNGRHIFYLNKQIETFDELNQLINAKKIGNNEFNGCTNLKSINLTNINYIGENAFKECGKLEIDIYIPNLSTLMQYAFRNSGITSISSLGDITVIPYACFQDCKKLININEGIFENIVRIEDYVFANCTYLESVPTAHSLTTIGKWTFQNCTSLTSFVLNTGITSIGDGAFYGDNTCVIEDLNCPNLSTLGNSAFRGTKLKKISNIGNVTVIKDSCFFECKQLTTIENNALDNVTTINGNAFYNCTSLTSVGTLSNLTTVAQWAFGNCPSLMGFEFNTGITSIGDGAFYGDTSYVINDLNLPNLTSLGNSAFRGTKLKKITSLGSITVIPDNCFYECSLLTTVEDNAFANITEIGNNAFYNCPISSLGGMSNIEKIGDNGLANCNISYIDLSHTKYIGGHAFGSNTNIAFKLTDAGAVDFTSVEFIGGWTFDTMNFNSSYVDLGTHLTSIRHQVFTTAHVNLIVRSSEVPDVSQGWRNLQPSDGYYTYVPAALIDEYKEKCSSYEWAFKTIENDLPAQYR